MNSSSSLMITTVKNIRGYRITVLNLFLSVTCLGFIVYCGYSAEALKTSWFMLCGLAASLSSVLQQVSLLAKRRSYARTVPFFTYLSLLYFLVMSSCLFIPLLITKEYSVVSQTTSPYAFYLMIGFSVNLVPLLVHLTALYGRHDQIIQNYLHPFTEIIDGFSKSSGSIQMTEIPANAVSGESLKQVVIGDEKKLTENQVDSDEESEVLSSHKANGTSPKPSKVLKTWPKADPFPVRALYTFKTESNSELPFRKGDTLSVLDCRGKWWQAQKEDRVGFIPSNYVAVLLNARVLSTFTASEDDEVSITKDQVIEVMEKYEEKCLVRTVDGKIGAVQTDRLEFLP